MERKIFVLVSWIRDADMNVKESHVMDVDSINILFDGDIDVFALYELKKKCDKYLNLDICMFFEKNKYDEANREAPKKYSILESIKKHYLNKEFIAGALTIKITDVIVHDQLYELKLELIQGDKQQILGKTLQAIDELRHALLEDINTYFGVDVMANYLG